MSFGFKKCYLCFSQLAKIWQDEQNVAVQCQKRIKELHVFKILWKDLKYSMAKALNWGNLYIQAQTVELEEEIEVE